MKPFGVILAGGRATRMDGADKALLPLGDETLLSRVVARFAPQVDRLAISANGGAARFEGAVLPVLPDSVAGFAGPLAGVLAGLDWAAAEGGASVVTAAVDTPFFPQDLVARLEQSGASVAVAATQGRAHPTFALWPVTLRDPLRTALQGGVRRVRNFADAQGALQVAFPKGKIDPFFNINTQADLERAEAMLRGIA